MNLNNILFKNILMTIAICFAFGSYNYAYATRKLRVSVAGQHIESNDNNNIKIKKRYIVGALAAGAVILRCLFAAPGSNCDDVLDKIKNYPFTKTCHSLEINNGILEARCQNLAFGQMNADHRVPALETVTTIDLGRSCALAGNKIFNCAGKLSQSSCMCEKTRLKADFLKSCKNCAIKDGHILECGCCKGCMYRGLGSEIDLGSNCEKLLKIPTINNCNGQLNIGLCEALNL